MDSRIGDSRAVEAELTVFSSLAMVAIRAHNTSYRVPERTCWCELNPNNALKDAYVIKS